MATKEREVTALRAVQPVAVIDFSVLPSPTGTALECIGARLITNDDIAAVVVPPTPTPPTPTPALPNTGIAPEGKSIPWDIIILTGIFMLVSTALVVVLRKRTI